MALSFLLAVLVVGEPCSARREAPEDSEDTMTLTLEDEGSHLELAVGAVVTLKLDCVPGTGYSWQVAEPDAALLEPVGESYFEPAKSEGEEESLGGAEVQVLRFRGREAGTGDLELHYGPAWEEGVEPEKVFRLTVEVRDSPD